MTDPAGASAPRGRVVLIDGRYAALDIGGIARHTCGVLRAMLALPGDERYVLLWNDSLIPLDPSFSAVLSHPRVRLERVAPSPFRAASVPSTTRAVRRARANVFFSTFHLVPLAVRCPSVVTVHDVRPLVGTWDGARERALFRVAMWFARRHAVRVIAPSAFTRDELVHRAGLDASRIVVAPPGFTPMSGGERGTYPLRPFALAVGPDRPHANQALLRETWTRMGDDAPLALVLAGAGQAAGGHTAHVTALGRVSADSLRQLYLSATMLLVPSLYEGAGSAMFDAWALGTPVIASDIAPFREAGGDAALFAAPTDANAWSAAIRRLHAHADERGALSERGRLRVRKFSWDGHARAVLDALRSVTR